MSPECRCGQFVSARYARVFSREDYDGRGDVGACPNCNIRREAGEFLEARSAGGRYSREVALE